MVRVQTITSHRPHHVDINHTIHVCDNLQPYYNTTEPDQMVSWETCHAGMWEGSAGGSDGIPV